TLVTWRMSSMAVDPSSVVAAGISRRGTCREGSTPAGSAASPGCARPRRWRRPRRGRRAGRRNDRVRSGGAARRRPVRTNSSAGGGGSRSLRTWSLSGNADAVRLLELVAARHDDALAGLQPRDDLDGGQARRAGLDRSPLGAAALDDVGEVAA